MQGNYSEKKRGLSWSVRFVLAAVMVVLAMFALAGCEGENPLTELLPSVTGPAQAEGVATQPNGEPVATVPADGNPADITCKGSYTVSAATADTVAKVGDAQLTNAQLQALYRMEIAAYRAAGQTPTPDFDKPLDTQECPLDGTAVTWQQYFLQEALNTWHSAQAMIALSSVPRPVTEELFKQNEELHENYLPKTTPVIEIMYGYDIDYDMNKWHQAYLDSLPQVLDSLAQQKGFADAAALAAAMGTDKDALAAVAELYNRGYMFFTELTYDITVNEEEVVDFRSEEGYDSTEKRVDVRHILVPVENAGDEQSAKKCLNTAQNMLNKWRNQKRSESTFADLAYQNSADNGTAIRGGLYSGLRKGQLMEALDTWCFDETRQSGDSTVIQTDMGCHLLYFCGSEEVGYTEAETALLERKGADQIADAKKAYPMEVTYSAIGVAEADNAADIAFTDVLYPDINHERYTQVPVYLQQDYRNAPYGDYWVSGHGCGITALAMLATYMADETLTPAMLAARYGEYCHYKGTDTKLFLDSPAQHDFYFERLAFNWAEVEEALKMGRKVIVLQFAGYFTTTGHFLVLENIREDGLVTVRDSNIYNYTRLRDHQIDGFKVSDIVPKGVQYFIYEEKQLETPGCGRCGEAGTTSEMLLNQDFCCRRCAAALTRRDAYLEFA